MNVSMASSSIMTTLSFGQCKSHDGALVVAIVNLRRKALENLSENDAQRARDTLDYRMKETQHR